MKISKGRVSQVYENSEQKRLQGRTDSALPQLRLIKIVTFRQETSDKKLSERKNNLTLFLLDTVLNLIIKDSLLLTP